MNLPPDVDQWLIRADFPITGVEAARTLLAQLSAKLSRERQRVIRCVIYLSRGNLEGLKHYAQAAMKDYRDVIYWAEYDDDDRQVNDFTRPFAGRPDGTV